MQLTYILATLICLTAFTLTLSFPLPSDQAKPPSLHATSSGVVPLFRDNSGFFAYIDLNSFESDASDSTINSQTVPMMLGLYTNKTLFINNCLNFSQYNCSNPTCDPFTWTTVSSSLPYFTAKGYKASAIAYLDYSRWNLYDYAVIGTSCTSNAHSEYGNSRFGVLGLGPGPVANGNYLNLQSVSIYLEKDLTQGHLYFGRNNSLWDANVKTIILNSDYNWHVFGEKSQLQVNDHLYNMSVKVIFDVGSDMMGFPLAIYKRLLSFLAEESVSCPDDVYSRPVCNYTGSIEDLPNITLHIQRKNITILPQIYVQSTVNTTVNGSTITLNFRALSPYLTGENYVTEPYKDHIILDINFMSYYYITFFGNTVSVNVAAPMSPPLMPTENNSLIFIILGSVAFIIIAIVGGCCYAYRRKKPRMFKTFETSETAELLVSTANSSCNGSPLL